MAEVIDTPQTVPKDRIKYTVDADTAWSKLLVSDGFHKSELTETYLRVRTKPMK